MDIVLRYQAGMGIVLRFQGGMGKVLRFQVCVLSFSAVLLSP